MYVCTKGGYILQVSEDLQTSSEADGILIPFEFPAGLHEWRSRACWWLRFHILLLTPLDCLFPQRLGESFSCELIKTVVAYHMSEKAKDKSVCDCVEHTSMDFITTPSQLADAGKGVPSGTIYRKVKKEKEERKATREKMLQTLLAAAKTHLGQRFQCRQKTNNAPCPPAMKRFKIRKQIQETSTPLPTLCNIHIMHHASHSVKRATTQLSPSKSLTEESLHGRVVEQNTTQHRNMPDVVAASDVVESTG